MTSTRLSFLSARRSTATVATAACLVGLGLPALVGVQAATAAPASLAAPAAPVAPAAPAAPAVPTIEQVSARVDQLNREAEQASEEYNTARERLSSIGVKVQAAGVRVAQQRARIGQTRDQLSRLAVVMYREGELSALEVVMSEEPDALLTRAGLGATVADRQSTLVQGLREQEEELAADQARVAAEQKAAEGVRAEMAAQKALVETKVTQAQAELARLRADQRRALERASRARQRQALARAGSPSTGSTSSSSAGSSGSRGGAVPVTPGAGGTVNCGGYTVSAPSTRAAKAIAFACSQLGDSYVWGAEGPDAWDCSGLTMGAWRKGGVSLPHSSRMQYGYGTRVSRSNLQPGDLVFFYSPISHVGIYLGNGMMIHAPNSRGVVRIVSMYDGYVGGVRL